MLMEMWVWNNECAAWSPSLSALRPVAHKPRRALDRRWVRENKFLTLAAQALTFSICWGNEKPALEQNSVIIWRIWFTPGGAKSRKPCLTAWHQPRHSPAAQTRTVNQINVYLSQRSQHLYHPLYVSAYTGLAQLFVGVLRSVPSSARALIADTWPFGAANITLYMQGLLHQFWVSSRQPHLSQHTGWSLMALFDSDKYWRSTFVIVSVDISSQINAGEDPLLFDTLTSAPSSADAFIAATWPSWAVMNTGVAPFSLGELTVH